MSTSLTTRMQALVQDLPSAPAPAAHVRRGAERLRRRQWAAAGAAVLAVVAIVAGLQVGGGGDRVLVIPAGPPVEPSPAPLSQAELALAATGVYTLLDPPFLTEEDWAQMTGDSGIRRVQEAPPRLLPCMDLPPTQGASEVRIAAFSETARSARIHEFVLRYDNDAGAERAVARIRQRYADCPPAPSGEWIEVIGPQWTVADRMDEGFWMERSGVDVALAGVPDVWQLGVARDANVVVLVESTGWGDRTSNTLERALSRALGNQGGRCKPFLNHDLLICPKAE